MFEHVFILIFSAKELSRGDTNVAYICSRYYRAPELVLGATEYTCQIGMYETHFEETKILQINAYTVH